MATNLDKYEDDLKRLINKGERLRFSFENYCHRKEFRIRIENLYDNDEEQINSFFKNLPDIKTDYQPWYSESLALLKQLLPDRVDDFVRYYEKSKTRKGNAITFENYVIEDALIGLRVVRGNQILVDTDAAIPKYEQQLSILRTLEKRLLSSLFDIRQLVQADLFDSELTAAGELNKNGFIRGAGAMAGVVLEKHLSQVCQNHKIQIRKKNPSISDYNDKLKEANVYDVPTWRKIQHLGDLRNLCDHDKQHEPSSKEVDELITGTESITKTIF